MDVSESKGKYDTSRNKGNPEEQGESTGNEPWEDEINPLGLLDLVYVEDEEERNHINETPVTSLISSKIGDLEEQKHPSDNSADSDEGDELEPLAAVDVLPGREEDFLPEGMTQEIMEFNRSTWTTCRVSNADLADHQWNLQESQLVDGESILQRVLEVPRQMWPVQIQPSGSHSTHQFTWKLAQQVNGSQNNQSEDNQSNRLWKQHEALPNVARRQQRYRQKNPELIRIRNREYARRYRQAHAERVRERQREYIKRYRERKRLEQEQAGLLGKSSEDSDIISMSDENGLHAAVLLGTDNSKNEVVEQNMPAVPIAMKSTSSGNILDSNESNEIVALS